MRRRLPGAVMAADPDVLLALLGKLERQMEALTLLSRTISERQIKTEAAVQYAEERRHAMANALQALAGEVGELQDALAGLAAPAQTSADERQFVAMVSWLSKHWQGLVALVAALAWLMTLLGVELRPRSAPPPPELDDDSADYVEGRL